MAASQCSVVRLAGGRRLGLRRWPGEGDPLVLLHGLLDSADGWSDLARHTRRPFLAFDLAGFGRSDHPERPEISAYAGDVVEALESLNVERWRFAGPVAALWGEHDALVPPAHARGLRAAAPQATVQVWPGMGHHPQRERPRQLAHFVEWHAAAAERRSSPRPALAA